MWVQSLGGADPLEGSWQPTLVFLPGESHGQRSLVGYSLWGHKELDMNEATSGMQNLGKPRNSFTLGKSLHY